MPRLSYLLLPVLACMCVMMTFLRSSVGCCVFFEATEVAHDVCDCLSSCAVVDRAYRFLDCPTGVFVCLSVVDWCSLAFLFVGVIRRDHRCTCTPSCPPRPDNSKPFLRKGNRSQSCGHLGGSQAPRLRLHPRTRGVSLQVPIRVKMNMTVQP